MHRSASHQLRICLTVGLLHQIAHACSPPAPILYFGPSFGPPPQLGFFPRSAPDVSTTNDPNILTAELQIFNEFSSNVDTELPVMIDLTTRTVSLRSPGIVPRPVPENTVRSADGLSFVIDGNSVVLSNAADILRNIRIDLEVPASHMLMSVEPYNGDVDAAFPFFFSNAQEKAFFLYETVQICTDAVILPSGGPCDPQIPTDSEIRSFVAVIDLETGSHRIQELEFRRLPWEYELFGGFPNNDFQFRRIWDSLQIVDDGIEPSCGADGPGLFFYDENGLQKIPDGFDVQSFNSLVPGNSSPRDLEAFRIVQTFVDGEAVTSVGLPEFSRYPSGFVVERYSVASGEVLQTFELDAAEIWALAQLEQPDPIPTTTNPPIPRPPPTTFPPLPTAQTPLPPVPSSTLAPFPTIPIAFPFPFPQAAIVPTPVQGEPTAPVPTLVAPVPTIPIVFPVSFPSRNPPVSVPTSPIGPRSFAPIPTIPIAWPFTTQTAPLPTPSIPSPPVFDLNRPTIPIAFP